MPEYVKKTMLGYDEVENGLSDEKCEFVILERIEYLKLKGKLHDLNTERNNLLIRGNEYVKQIQQIEECQEASTINQRERYDELCRKIQQLKEEINCQMEKLDKELFSIKNKKRILIERANADRGIIRKKSHDGYLILQSKKWREHFFQPDLLNGNNISRSIDAWRTTIQTPYLSCFTYREIRKQISFKLICDILMCSKGSIQEIKTECDRNIAFRWILRANYIKKYWEVDAFTTKAPKIMPDRIPPK